MKVKVIMENTARGNLACAHGLSIYVETEKHKILVDAGPDFQYVKNAKAMGVDIADIDMAFLSHGHFDHSGGLGAFIKFNEKARIYAAKGYDKPHYNRVGAYIGVEPSLIGHPRIKVTMGDLKIDDEVTILDSKDRPRVREIENNGMTEGVLYQFREATLMPETFAHEQYLLVGNVLFSGCSHVGIVNIASWAKEMGVKTIVGGFHFKDVKPEDFGQLDSVAEALLDTGIKFYTCHCTGLEQYAYLKEKMGTAVEYVAAGDKLEL